MFRRWQILAVALTLSACASTGGEEPFFAPSLLTTGYTCGSNPRVLSALDSSEVDWFSSQLEAAREPSLYGQSLQPDSHGTKSYRFTWLRSFHVPIIVRIDEDASGRMHLTAKRLTGAGGYAPGHIGAVIDRYLNPQEADEFRKRFAEENLMALSPMDCTVGLDGAEWIVEERTGTDYRFVKRWSPSHGPVRAIGDLMIAFTHWNPRPVY
jgi:hypothetical protein